MVRTKSKDRVDDNIIKKLQEPVQAKRPMLGHVVPKASRSRVLPKNVKKSGGSSRSPILRPQGRTRDTNLNNPSNLRIIGGTFKGRRLSSPTSVYLRPMMGKVRSAVFSTLTSFGLFEAVAEIESDAVRKVRHLDVFAGSGSVGLESLSRGAREVTFVDLAKDCCEAVQRNLNICGVEGRGRVVNCDALVALRDPHSVGVMTTSGSTGDDVWGGGAYDLITVCPPYEEVVYADLLDALLNSDCCKEDTIVLLEYPVELGCLPHVLEANNNPGKKMLGLRNRKYGRTVIAMYIVSPSGRLPGADIRPEEFVNL